MSIETEMVSYLKGLTLENQIGMLIDGQRLYPLDFPQSDEPSEQIDSQVAYEIVSRTKVQDQSGASGLVQTRWRFDCRAGSDGTTTGYDRVRALEKSLLAAFFQRERRDGLWIGTIWIQSAEVIDASDDDTPPRFQDEFGLFHAMVNLETWHEE